MFYQQFFSQYISLGFDILLCIANSKEIHILKSDCSVWKPFGTTVSFEKYKKSIAKFPSKMTMWD